LLLLWMSHSDYNNSACIASWPVSYCGSIEAAVSSLGVGTYITKLLLRGAVAINHVVLSSALMQRPLVITSESAASPATLYCSDFGAMYAAANVSLGGVVEVCGLNTLTIRDVVIVGCSSTPFVRGINARVVLRNVTVVAPSHAPQSGTTSNGTAVGIGARGTLSSSLSPGTTMAQLVRLSNSSLSVVEALTRDVSITPVQPGEFFAQHIINCAR
jgi:hypothetical protein